MLAGVTRADDRERSRSTASRWSAHLTDIGYVPQDEIVHPKLTVREALRYSAKLRLPSDAGRDDIEGAVERGCSHELSLEQHAETQIGSLSGGQRKRAGVASELLSRPSLLLLDEATTGLDPGLETRMMELMRELADNERAVITITHATKNLGLCDKVVVMGRGGDLCFFGSPDEALRFFRTDEYDGVYRALDERPAAAVAGRSSRRPPPGAGPDGTSERRPAVAGRSRPGAARPARLDLAVVHARRALLQELRARSAQPRRCCSARCR